MTMMKKISAMAMATAMAATMAVGTAISASADSANVYPLALKDGSTTETSMMQSAFTGSAGVYDEDAKTLTFEVQSFTVERLFVKGTGYLTSIVLYVDNDGTAGYSDDDLVLSEGEVSPSLKETSPSTITFTDVKPDEYEILQDYIVSAHVSYDLSIFSGSYSHSDSEADFTLNSSFLTYPDKSVSIGTKPYYTVD